ncbi:MarR family winged helix-turn-helix transcriptional regulator [Streptomyces liangshanensis]|uniref:MarR family winged helix-turn-helix transcriptional regulator n=1 Tax=Streptomyces liangshanensis TaxID=2717324 RepID=UPI0036D85E3C
MTGRRNEAARAAVDLSLALGRLRGRLRAEGGPGSSVWTRSQLAALHRVAGGPPATTSDLAAAEYMRPQSMAQTLAALEKGGLITRHPDPDDGRRFLVVATDEGREVLRAAMEGREAWLAYAIETTLSPAELAALPGLIEVLDRLAASPPGVPPHRSG